MGPLLCHWSHVSLSNIYFLSLSANYCLFSLVGWRITDCQYEPEFPWFLLFLNMKIFDLLFVARATHEQIYSCVGTENHCYPTEVMFLSNIYFLSGSRFGLSCCNYCLFSLVDVWPSPVTSCQDSADMYLYWCACPLIIQNKLQFMYARNTRDKFDKSVFFVCSHDLFLFC